MQSTMTTPVPAPPEPPGRQQLSIERLCAELREPCAVSVDRRQAVVRVRERGMLAHYRFSRRRSGELGFSELLELPWGGSSEHRVTVAEVMAVVRGAVPDGSYDEEVAELVCSETDLWTRRLRAAGRAREAGRTSERFRLELACAELSELYPLRPVQLAIVARLEAGERVCDLCERGGFVSSSGQPDTTWLLRRAGFLFQVCSRTRKIRLARVARHTTYARLVRAVGGDPVDFGV